MNARSSRISSNPPSASDVSFEAGFPRTFCSADGQRLIPAWHLVGGKDPIDAVRADRQRTQTTATRCCCATGFAATASSA